MKKLRFRRTQPILVASLSLCVLLMTGCNPLSDEQKSIFDLGYHPGVSGCTSLPLSGLRYATSNAGYEANVTISQNSASFSVGTVSSCSISPALPSGLVLNATSCHLTGTPTGSGGAQNTYTVTAKSCANSTTGTLTLRVNGQTDLWTWISGTSTRNQAGIYGTKGTAAAANVPGGRYSSGFWKDASGNFWLFGGYGYGSVGGLSYLNDLWKWDGTNWTWVSGANTINQSGTYGVKGTAAAANIPGGRFASASWTDVSGNFWLFGGIGYDSAGGLGRLNDLWKWDGTNWTWVSGANVMNQSGTYGVKGTPAAANVPGSRNASARWSDTSGNVWFFGGLGYDSAGALSYLGDLWKWDGANWTWVSGANTVNQSGTYGVKGTAAAANVPGGRSASSPWSDASGNLWLFGGLGHDSAGATGRLNDLWKWDGTNWTWVSGANTVNQSGTYGTKGTAAASNIPGGRNSSARWIDTSGNFWLFGGYGYDSVGGLGSLNSLWKWDGTNWTWVSGANTVNQSGIYGTKGTPAAANFPGGMYAPNFWMDSSGQLWLFGGWGYDSVGANGHLNDLWKYVY